MDGPHLSAPPLSSDLVSREELAVFWPHHHPVAPTPFQSLTRRREESQITLEVWDQVSINRRDREEVGIAQYPSYKRAARPLVHLFGRANLEQPAGRQYPHSIGKGQGFV